MALTVTPIRMDSDVVAELDALAAKQNTTRSELIREAVATMLATKQKGRR
jgi:predicted transcriptional regulator